MDDFEKQLKEIESRFEVIKKEGQSDCKINKLDPFDRFNTEMLESWIRKKSTWLKINRAYETKKREKFKSLWEYYKTDHAIKLSTKDEYEMFILSDPQYTSIAILYNSTKEVIAYIDAIIETLKSRQWDLKNYLDWKKFEAGQ